MLAPEFTPVRYIPPPEVISLMRGTLMLKPDPGTTDQFTKPYDGEDIKISLEAVAEEEYFNLWKTSLYVARNLLATQNRIADAIAKEGFKRAELFGGLVLSSKNEKGEPITTNLLPPIIEEIVQPDGSIMRVLMDGSHCDYDRYTVQKETWMAAIVIRGVTMPSYAAPNERSALTVHDSVPTVAHQKKWYANAKPEGGDITKIINLQTGKPFNVGDTVPPIIDPRTGKEAEAVNLYRGIPNGIGGGGFEPRNDALLAA